MTETSDEHAEVARLARLVDHTHDLVVVVGTDGGVLDANPATSNLLGYPRSEVLAMNAVDIVDPNDLPRAAEHFARALDGVSSIDPIDIRIRRKDGHWRWFEVRVDSVDDTSFALNAHDVTDRRRAATVLDGHTRALTLVSGHEPLAEVVTVVGESVREVLDDGRVAVVCVGRTQLVWAPDFPTGWGRALTVGLQGAETAVEGLDALLDSLSGQHDLPSATATPIRTSDGRDVGRILVYREGRRPLPEDLRAALGSFAEIVAIAAEQAPARRDADAVTIHDA